MTLVLAQADPAVVLADALEIYRQQTGVTLAPADPRRLHLQALLLLLAQHRSLIDFSGKQSMLRYVTSLWIQELAALWGESLLPAEPSTCRQNFHFSPSGTYTVPAGTRVTDGTNVWAVVTATTGTATTVVQCQVACIVAGAASNGVAIGQISTPVDNLPDLASVDNASATIGGRDVEATEAFRTRLRSVPETRSTCGPRIAYEAQALAASASVADARALGPQDEDDLAGYAPPPGHVVVLIIEGTRDAAGNLLSVIPAPTSQLQIDVSVALSAETVRPLTDYVAVLPPAFVDYDLLVTYYIARSRSASVVEIEAAVTAAIAAYEIAQTRIGLDINPDVLIAAIVDAGAKRCVVSSPSYTVIYRDQCSRLVYVSIAYGGVEND